MKNLFLASILISLYCLTAPAQTNENLACPKISVIGQSGITQSGKIVTFTADLGKEADKFSPKYNWTVSSGIIIEGQGTLIIKVLQDYSQENYRATIEVIGLPKGCPNTFTESLVISNRGDPLLFDEFSTPATRIDRVRLNKLLIELRDNPAVTAYIIEGFKRKTSQKIIRLKLQKLNDYLFKVKRIKKARIVILTAVYDANSTWIYIAPSGAPPSAIRNNK